MERALYQGLIVSGGLAAVAFLPISLWLMDDLKFKSTASTLITGGGGTSPSGFEFWFCSLIGIAITALLFVITDYYTSTRFRPVKSTARASQTGHATNIIQGLAQGFQSTAAPAIVLALGILLANELAGIYGIGVAVMAQLSLTGLIVALDAFGPITDNAGGIAEMAELPGGRAQRDRPARRGRQHHQGRDQGLRNRLGRAGRTGAVRGVRRGAARRGVRCRQDPSRASTSRNPRCWSAC